MRKEFLVVAAVLAISACSERQVPAPAPATQPAAESPAPVAPIESADTPPAAAPIVEPAPVRPALWGTAWRLESLAGAGVLDRAQATLEFRDDGRASGSGSCNRFNGIVTLEGDAIKFAGLVTTRMACADAVMKQEDAYLAALQDAERFESDGQSLAIFAAGRAEPLRFVAAEAPPAQRTGISAAPRSAGTAPALAGIWTVIAQHAPGTTAASSTQSRHGETVRLTANAAVSSGQRCREPGYATSRVDADAWLASEFKLPRGALAPLAGRGQINVMRVSCGGAPWNALGAVLLEADAGTALAPWNGVFYELQRDRDFRALGQEPGWQLEIRKGSEIRFIYDYGRNSAVAPAPAAQVDSGNGTRTYHAVTDANDLQVVIVPVACNDSMSGRPFPATVSVTLNGQTYRGCGEELATPFQG